jgi:hypothetical protein
MSKKKSEDSPSGLLPIEKLKKLTGVKDSVFAGVMKANGWAEGLEMTEDEFKKAVDNWLKSPVGPKPKTLNKSVKK